MAKANSTDRSDSSDRAIPFTARPGVTPAPQDTTDPQELRNTINLIDALSQDGFSHIFTIADLALAAMEAPRALPTAEALAKALRAIRNTADRTRDDINTAAEDAGCNYIDPAERRRYAASAEDARLRGAMQSPEVRHA